MRIFTVRLTALLPVLLFATGIATAQQQTPILAATTGTGSNTFFFALDFRDFAAPQFYSFGYRSNASSISFADLLSGLTAIPTFTTRISNSAQFGLSLDGLGYAGKEKFNGVNSGEPFGYFAQYNSPDGINWGFNDFGISQQPPISPNQWFGASWVSDYRTVAAAPPRVAFTPSATNAPEPGAGLLLLWGGGAVSAVRGVVRCRRRATRGR